MYLASRLLLFLSVSVLLSDFLAFNEEALKSHTFGDDGTLRITTKVRSFIVLFFFITVAIVMVLISLIIT